MAILLLSCTHDKFSGNVYDFDSNKPIQSVWVSINEKATQTDSSGYFCLDVNSKSSCILTFRKVGYSSKQVSRKPDASEQDKNLKIKTRTIYMFRKESDFMTKK
ncbi:carboxypeptidase-like regulatory domain-containing protein [Flavobacterium foetidum]|uniref:carboxypeptidase-like regulatory domain-containing protein n=1 Tax=Flavobacterium foetidum TaxID=2026681 RepID=UPI0013C36A88|nr:carboxypeptidase-like regulatory domain-containing protein [Flavobacterium foetidum]KAF2517753.1 carboxypeptidase-like regulatory domain-containing protein [Flavobacterium foetidum]